MLANQQIHESYPTFSDIEVSRRSVDLFSMSQLLHTNVLRFRRQPLTGRQQLQRNAKFWSRFTAEPESFSGWRRRTSGSEWGGVVVGAEAGRRGHGRAPS